MQDMVIHLHMGKHKLCALLLTEEGEKEEFHLLTNLWGVEAETLKRLYEAWWQIEILFRAVKQEFWLKAKRSIRMSLNAIIIQIYCAILTYLALSIYRHLVCGDLTVFEVLRQIKYTRKRVNVGYPPWERGPMCLATNLTPQEVS